MVTIQECSARTWTQTHHTSMEVAAGSGDQDRHGHVTWRLCSDAMYLHTGIYTVHWYVSKLDNAGVRTQYPHDFILQTRSKCTDSFKQFVDLEIEIVCMYCNRGGPQLWPPGVGGWGEGRVRDMAILINIVMINFARDQGRVIKIVEFSTLWLTHSPPKV